MRVHISANAQIDLLRISEWIARDDPDAAIRFVAALTAKAIEIGDMPFAFPLFASRRGVEFRKRTYRRYLILYTVMRSRVTVSHIVHGRRDLSQLFGLS